MFKGDHAGSDASFGVIISRSLKPDGSGERILTSGYLVESPTWAPNGRVLIFFRQMRPKANGRSGQVKLFSIDLTGFNEREIITPNDASDPAWSPLNN